MPVIDGTVGRARSLLYYIIVQGERWPQNKGKDNFFGFLAKKCKEYFYIPLKISNFAVRNTI